jgi:hypothetical protein
MTEAKWLGCSDPVRMLEYLRGKVSDRKLRLFAVACSYAMWDRLTNPQDRRATEVAELYAEGLAHSEVLHAAGAEANTIASTVTYDDAWHAADVSWNVSWVMTGVSRIALVHDIFGNPFRPVLIEPRWLTQTVTSLAAAAYEERSLPSGELEAARLAVLADALEEAGCRDQSILDHLRSPGPHIRGCWPLDLILGRA